MNSIYKPAGTMMMGGAVMQASEFDTIFQLHFKRVYNFISYRINNHHDTDDLVSLVFEKVIAKYGTYDERLAPMEAWIIGIAKNVVNDYSRKKNRRFFIPFDSMAEFLQANDKPDDIALKNEENEDLMIALNNLSKKERTIIAMKFAAQLKNKNIAKIMGLSESNTGVILHRSVEKLRRELTKKEGV